MKCSSSKGGITPVIAPFAGSACPHGGQGLETREIRLLRAASVSQGLWRHWLQPVSPQAQART